MFSLFRRGVTSNEVNTTQRCSSIYITDWFQDKVFMLFSYSFIEDSMVETGNLVPIISDFVLCSYTVFKPLSLGKFFLISTFIKYTKSIWTLLWKKVSKCHEWHSKLCGLNDICFPVYHTVTWFSWHLNTFFHNCVHIDSRVHLSYGILINYQKMYFVPSSRY